MVGTKKVIEDLENRRMSVREIIQEYGLTKKESIDILKAISKSILPKKRLVRVDAVCRFCGFVFKNRDRFDTPTKCPKCRGESITEVKYYIEES